MTKKKYMKVIFTILTVALSLGLGSCGKKDPLVNASGALICGAANRFSIQDPACACQVPTGSFGQSTSSFVMTFTSTGPSTALVAQPFVNVPPQTGENLIGQVTVNMSTKLSTDTVSAMNVSIRPDCNGKPCGTKLATGSFSGSLPVVAAPSATKHGSPFMAILSNVVILNGQTTYWIVVQGVGIDTTSGTGAWQLDAGFGSFPGATGKLSYSNDDGATWTAWGNSLSFSIATCN